MTNNKLEYSIDNIAYKQYLMDCNNISDDGYFCNGNLKYIQDLDSKNIYCFEVNIINKIKENQDGYFDFSKNMIDIGSETGTYSFILPFNYFYMFEGNKDKCILAQMNMLLHHKSNRFDCFNVLLSDKVENIKYDGFFTNYTMDNILFDDNNINIYSTKPLDNYNLDNIGFIKIDVEGMEYQVLKGGIGTIIRNNYPPILFELWPVGYWGMTQTKFDQLVKFLENELGYEILWEWGQFDTHLAIHK